MIKSYQISEVENGLINMNGMNSNMKQFEIGKE
jgi:hypothetical protein